ncbi:MAG: histidine phosphatase family protein [Balneolaceae bacterium]|nr:histidine phosphatase family protein [Balneolaceae bacterium]
MKHILLLRHAKSSWDDSSLDDFDRPLAKRGKKDAPRMGAFIKKSGYLPDKVYSSTAKRARQTTRLFCEPARLEDETITWTEDFYYGSAYDYLEAIQQSPDNAETVMLVGHNPKMEEIASLLCSDNKSYTVRMPTAALVCLEHPAVKWKQVREGTARIKWMMIPKLLKKL